jgi:hypothetical protein
MSGGGVRILQLTPPTGDGVQCGAIARERETARWSQIAPLLQEIQIGKVPAGSRFANYQDGWATFTTPDGAEMRFDLREPLKLHEGDHMAPDTSRPN